MKQNILYTYVGYRTLFIDYFIDIMEQYFHYWNHNYWQCKELNTTEEIG